MTNRPHQKNHRNESPIAETLAPTPLVSEPRLGSARVKTSHPSALAQDLALMLELLAAYFALMKPRVMSLVIFTAIIGLVISPSSVDPVLAFFSIIAIALGAGASGALNMYVDADIDGKMERTQSRPIPSGLVSRDAALFLGVIGSVVAIFILGLASNLWAAGLLAYTIFHYGYVYSVILKRRTVENIVIGGAAGAFPPVISVLAMHGSVTAESLALFLIIFIWTPPHFWALSLLMRDEYAKADVPMLPVIKGDAVTKRRILNYSWVLFPCSLLPVFVGSAGAVYFITAFVLSSWLIYLSYRLAASAEDAQPRASVRLFLGSISYLFILFLAIAVDRLATAFIPINSII